ncbi:GGDEF domain-containing protein [Desulfobulbus sp. AH-315-M07]|nr:GGDEF domain-containing protein [Desulfobulbus sp. AH-315-M07]
MRVAFGLSALLLAPMLVPKTAAHRWAAGAYLVVSLVSQLMMDKEVGGRARALLMGLVDMAMLTFYVHRLGSLNPTLLPLYVMAGMFHALAHKIRLAQLIALFGSVCYLGVQWAEYTGVLGYGPDAPEWDIMTGTVQPIHILTTGGVLVLVLLGSTSLVGKLLNELNDREAELERLSEHDPLTQLFNRRYLMECIDHQIERVKRGHPLSAVMIDLDHFKNVNDKLGHQSGDEMLIAVAEALRGATRKVDVAARYGGDEFLLLFPDTTADEAGPVVDRVLEGIRRAGRRFGDVEPVTASMGLTEATRDDDAQAVIRRADENAYEAKRAGRDRCVR